MKVSILIATLRPEEELADLIQQIHETAAHDIDLIIVSGDRSCSVNRNIGLNKVNTEYVIMCDDDIDELPLGWDKALIDALKMTGASMVGARLLNPDKTLQPVNYKSYDLSKDWVKVKTMITTCCAIRNATLRFDENFVGGGFEDTDFCRQLGGEFYVVNTVKVVHRNECKRPFKQKNKSYFREKWAGQ
jgi:glycosyltransferase involved in cell wall biosynthesis